MPKYEELPSLECFFETKTFGPDQYLVPRGRRCSGEAFYSKISGQDDSRVPGRHPEFQDDTQVAIDSRSRETTCSLSISADFLFIIFCGKIYIT